MPHTQDAASPALVYPQKQWLRTAAFFCDGTITRSPHPTAHVPEHPPPLVRRAQASLGTANPVLLYLVSMPASGLSAIRSRFQQLICWSEYHDLRTHIVMSRYLGLRS